jgi:HEAT repeat protein
MGLIIVRQRAPASAEAPQGPNRAAGLPGPCRYPAPMRFVRPFCLPLCGIGLLAVALLFCAASLSRGGLPPASAADAVARQVEILADKRMARDAFQQRERQKAIAELGRIGSAEAAAALLPVFEDPFVHLHDHAVSAWITMLQGSAAPDVQTWLTQRALGHRTPEIRRAAAVALGLTSGPEISDPIRVALKKEKDGTVLAALADAVVHMRVKPTLDGVLLTRFKHKDGVAVFALTQAAVEIDGEAAQKPLLGLLKHKAPLARAGAVLALQRLGALPEDRLDAVLEDRAPEPAMALAEALEFSTGALTWPEKGPGVLARLLAADSWRVRAAAVQGALRVWRPEIVDLLIARLGVETGRLEDDVQRALETYTHKSIGSDPALWRAWWIQNHTAFDAGPRPEKDRAGNIAFREAGATNAEGLSETVAFFDVPLRSKRLAFVFDLSGSMKDPVRKGDESGQTKFQLLQAEVKRTLTLLPPDTDFDLFVYRYGSKYPPPTKLTRALGKQLPATKGNVTKATGWLAHPDQAPKGWGAFFEPLSAVFEEDVDTVVLLSDGRPSRGLYDRDFRLLQEIPRANRFRRVAVNTVLVGTNGADRKFLEALAAATGGRFRAAGAK